MMMLGVKRLRKLLSRLGKDHLAKNFPVLAGWATLCAASYVFLTGPALSISYVLWTICSLMTLITLHQQDDLKRMRNSLYPLLLSHFKDFGPETVPQLASVSKRPMTKDIVIDMLEAALCVELDIVQRHWIYVALGYIPDKRTRSLIEEFCPKEEAEMVKRAAKNAHNRISEYLRANARGRLYV